MKDPITEFANEMINRRNRLKNDYLKVVLIFTGLKPDEIKQRGSFEIGPPSEGNIETFLLDGEPLFKIEDIRVSKYSFNVRAMWI